MREQLPRLLTDRNFANVALILNELQLLATLGMERVSDRDSFL